METLCGALIRRKVSRRAHEAFDRWKKRSLVHFADRQHLQQRVRVGLIRRCMQDWVYAAGEGLEYKKKWDEAVRYDVHSTLKRCFFGWADVLRKKRTLADMLRMRLMIQEQLVKRTMWRAWRHAFSVEQNVIAARDHVIGHQLHRSLKGWQHVVRKLSRGRRRASDQFVQHQHDSILHAFSSWRKFHRQQQDIKSRQSLFNMVVRRVQLQRHWMLWKKLTHAEESARTVVSLIAMRHRKQLFRKWLNLSQTQRRERLSTVFYCQHMLGHFHRRWKYAWKSAMGLHVAEFGRKRRYWHLWKQQTARVSALRGVAAMMRRFLLSHYVAVWRTFVMNQQRLRQLNLQLQKRLKISRGKHCLALWVKATHHAVLLDEFLVI